MAADASRRTERNDDTGVHRVAPQQKGQATPWPDWSAARGAYRPTWHRHPVVEMAAENFAASARPSLRRGDRGAQGWRPAIMNAAIDRSRIIIGVDPVLVFALRCWARAALVQAGEICLQEAVDVLQADAERDGIIVQL